MMLANIGWSILMVEVFYMERAEYGFKEYKNRDPKMEYSL